MVQVFQDTLDIAVFQDIPVWACPGIVVIPGLAVLVETLPRATLGYLVTPESRAIPELVVIADIPGSLDIVAFPGIVGTQVYRVILE